MAGLRPGLGRGGIVHSLLVSMGGCCIMGVGEGVLSGADEGARGAKIRGRVSEADDDAFNIVDIMGKQRDCGSGEVRNT